MFHAGEFTTRYFRFFKGHLLSFSLILHGRRGDPTEHSRAFCRGSKYGEELWQPLSLSFKQSKLMLLFFSLCSFNVSVFIQAAVAT